MVPSVCFTPWSGVRIPLTTAPASLPCTPLFVAMRHLPPTGGSLCSLAAVSSAAIPVRVKLKIPRANAAAATTLDIPTGWDLQQRRPRPVADAGRSCWGSGQQDASAAQGTMRMLGAATRKKRRPFQSFRLIYSSQMAVAPQGTTPPVADTGRPISSQLVLPPKRGTSVVLSIYSMTAGDRPVV